MGRTVKNIASTTNMNAIAHAVAVHKRESANAKRRYDAMSKEQEIWYNRRISHVEGKGFSMDYIISRYNDLEVKLDALEAAYPVLKEA